MSYICSQSYSGRHEKGKETITITYPVVLNDEVLEFYHECAERSGENFAYWLDSMFKGEF